MSDVPEREEGERAKETFAMLKQRLSEVILGQEELIEKVLVGILANGHILLEGLPGLGKTALVNRISQLLGLETKRLQFTPDLLPGDITGNPILQEKNGQKAFVFQPGPVFTNLLLADEINRASPKTQSALLEAMQERRVTVMGESHELPVPFFVLATQNPIELEGTYPLPEAQLDRFLFHLQVGRPRTEVLEKILAISNADRSSKLDPVVSRDEVLSLSDVASRVYLPPVVMNFIARLVDGSHEADERLGAQVRCGASPRAALAFASAGRVLALVRGRSHVSYEDVQELAIPILAHRVILDYGTRRKGIDAVTYVESLVQRVKPLQKEIPESVLEGN